MPRLLASLVTLPLAVALAGLVVLDPGAARACACGAAYPPVGHTVSSGAERAFLSRLPDGRERLEMALTLTSDGDDLAVLVPTPTAPEVAQGSIATFDELARLSTRPVREHHESHRDGNATAAAPHAAPSVVSTTVLDDVVATVIKGGTPAGVTRWLSQHGYAQKPQTEPVIASYLHEGWTFTAIKLRADRPSDGTLSPVVLTFVSPTLVYPMRLSSVATEPESVTAYVLDDAFVRRGDDSTGDQHADLTAAVDLADIDVHDDSIAAAVKAGDSFLTTWDIDVADPATLTSDFVFVPDGGIDATWDADDVRQAAGGTSADGTPVGVLVGLGVLAVLAAGGVGLLVWRPLERAR